MGGEALEPFVRTVEPEAVARVAAILRDPNPIHLDPAAAGAVGLAGPINQGPANLAYAVNMLLAAFPGACVLSIESRYLANVTVGDRVQAEGSVLSREGSQVTCEFRVLNGAGIAAVIGTAVLRLASAGGG
jgi:3-hydroxybutyryl-CoA dehydratase